MRGAPSIPRILGVGLTAFALLSAHARPDDAPPTTAQGVQHIEAGPITVDLTLDRSSLNAAESLVATLRVVSPPSVAVELPAAAEKLGGFAIAATKDEPGVVVSVGGESRTCITRAYTLEPFLPGDYTLPPIEVEWRRTASGEAGVARTAPVVVRVVSLLPQAAQTPDADLKALDPGSIRDAYEAHTRRGWLFPTVVGVSLASGALLTGLGARALLRRRTVKEPTDALVARVRAIRDSESPCTPELCHELANAIQSSLVDRFGERVRSMSAPELAARLSDVAPQMAGEAPKLAELCASLDGYRFSGEAVPLHARDKLVRATLDALLRLRETPRDHGEAP